MLNLERIHTAPLQSLNKYYYTIERRRLCADLFLKLILIRKLENVGWVMQTLLMNTCKYVWLHQKDITVLHVFMVHVLGSEKKEKSFIQLYLISSMIGPKL